MTFALSGRCGWSRNKQNICPTWSCDSQQICTLVPQEKTNRCTNSFLPSEIWLLNAQKHVVKILCLEKIRVRLDFGSVHPVLLRCHWLVFILLRCLTADVSCSIYFLLLRLIKDKQAPDVFPHIHSCASLEWVWLCQNQHHWLIIMLIFMSFVLKVVWHPTSLTKYI